MERNINYGENNNINTSPYLYFILFFLVTFVLLNPYVFSSIIKVSNSNLIAGIIVSLLIGSLAFIISGYHVWYYKNNYEYVVQT